MRACPHGVHLADRHGNRGQRGQKAPRPALCSGRGAGGVRLVGGIHLGQRFQPGRWRHCPRWRLPGRPRRLSMARWRRTHPGPRSRTAPGTPPSPRQRDSLRPRCTSGLPMGSRHLLSTAQRNQAWPRCHRCSSHWSGCSRQGSRKDTRRHRCRRCHQHMTGLRQGCRHRRWRPRHIRPRSARRSCPGSRTSAGHRCRRQTGRFLHRRQPHLGRQRTVGSCPAAGIPCRGRNRPGTCSCFCSFADFLLRRYLWRQGQTRRPGQEPSGERLTARRGEKGGQTVRHP